MATKCKSGLHAWTNADDAAKCCNGFKHQLMTGAKASECDDFYGWYGYKWVPIEGAAS